MASMDIDTDGLASPAGPGEAPEDLVSRLSLRDKLLFAQGVHKVGAGENRWKDVGDLMRANPMVSLPEGFFEPQTCATIYTDLMIEAGFANLDQLKDGERSNAPQHLRMAQHFYVARMEELRGEIEREEGNFRTLVAEIEAMKSGDASYMLLSIFSLTNTADSPITTYDETISILDEVKSALVINRKRKASEGGGGVRPRSYKKVAGGIEVDWLPLYWKISNEELARMATIRDRPPPETLTEPIIAAPLQIQPVPKAIQPIPTTQTASTRNVIIVPDDDANDPVPQIPGERYGKDVQMAQTLAPSLPGAGPSGRPARSSTLTGATPSTDVVETPKRDRAAMARRRSTRKGEEEEGIISDEIAESPVILPSRGRRGAAKSVQPPAKAEEPLPEETGLQAQQAILQGALAPDTVVGEDAGLVAFDENGADISETAAAEAILQDRIIVDDTMDVDQESAPATVVEAADDADQGKENRQLDDDVRSNRSELTPAPASIASDPSPPPMSPALPPAKLRNSTPGTDQSGAHQAGGDAAGKSHDSVKPEPLTTTRPRRGTRSSVAVDATAVRDIPAKTEIAARRRSSRQQQDDTASSAAGTPGRSLHGHDEPEEQEEPEQGSAEEDPDMFDIAEVESQEQVEEEPTVDMHVAQRGKRKKLGDRAADRAADRGSSPPARSTRGSRAISSGLDRVVEDGETPGRSRRVPAGRKGKRRAIDESENEGDVEQVADVTDDGVSGRSGRGNDSADEDAGDVAVEAASRKTPTQRKAEAREKEKKDKELEKLEKKELKRVKDKERYYEDRRRRETQEAKAEKPTPGREAQLAAAASSDVESSRPSARRPSLVPSSIEDSPVKENAPRSARAGKQQKSASPARATRSVGGLQRGPIEKKVKQMLNNLHEEIESHIHARVFSAPIRASDAPGYADIVKQPMHLKKIKARIKQGAIISLDEYQRDLWLMFCNAMMYNRPGSEVYDMAEEMMLWCEDKLSTARNLEHHNRIKHST